MHCLYTPCFCFPLKKRTVKIINCVLHIQKYVWCVSSSWSFVVCRCISLYVGNVWRMETGDLFFAYDFLELSVYYFSGSVDFSTDIFFNYKEYQKNTPFNTE